MAIFGSFVHCLPNILHIWPHDSFQVIRLSMTLGYFKVIWLFYIKFLKNGVWYGKSYYRQLIGNHTLAFDWCHFWWPWSTCEGHFSLGCHFHIHFRNPWHAFASHRLPAIAELLVVLENMLKFNGGDSKTLGLPQFPHLFFSRYSPLVLVLVNLIQPKGHVSNQQHQESACRTEESTLRRRRIHSLVVLASSLTLTTQVSCLLAANERLISLRIDSGRPRIVLS